MVSSVYRVYMGLSQIEHDRCWSCNFCHAQSLLYPPFFILFQIGAAAQNLKRSKSEVLNTMMDSTKSDIVTFVMHNPFSPFLFFFKLGQRIWKGVKVLNIMMDGSKTDIVRFYGLTSAGRNAFVTRFSYSIAAVCSSNEWVIPTRIRTPWFVITNRVLL